MSNQDFYQHDNVQSGGCGGSDSVDDDDDDDDRETPRKQQCGREEAVS